MNKIIKLYDYIMMKKIHKYSDANGRLYNIGDIVFNPFFCDYWVVQKCTRKEKKQYGLNMSYCFALYGNKDDYCIDLDEPSGFKIVISKDSDEYAKAYKELLKVAKLREEELS